MCGGVGVVSGSGPWWPLSCLCGACVGVAAQAGPGAGVALVGAFCGPVFRSGFPVLAVFSGLASDLARHTGGVRGTLPQTTGESASRQNQRRRSSELSAHQMGRHPY